METIHVTLNELTVMASEQFSSGPGLLFMTPATSSSGLVPNPIPQQPFNPLTRNDWDRLFQPMFNEYFNPLSSVVSPVPVAAAPRVVDIVGSLSSTTIDQDAPSSSISSTNQQQQSSIISQGVEEPIPNALFDDPCHEPLHDVSTSQESSSNGSGIFNDHHFNKYTANNLPLRGGHSIVDPSCDVLSLGALYSWEFLLKFHLHACDLGS
ncbi:hypothetical protein Tco_0698459 [Tanacetum coccineum]